MAISLVVKVGGSLYNLPELGPRLQRWLATLPDRNVLLVPGGGASVECVRELDRCHQLGEERSHWLALQALRLNAHFLAMLLGSRMIGDVEDGKELQEGIVILDALHFARSDVKNADRLPHCWDVTSDSIAARVAAVIQARELILLKSVTIPDDMTWTKAAELGHVDPYFARTIPPQVRVRALNFRAWGS